MLRHAGGFRHILGDEAMSSASWRRLNADPRQDNIPTVIGSVHQLLGGESDV
jgi:hypothetical protein